MQTKQELRSFHLNPSQRKTRAKLLLRTTERRAGGIQDKKKSSLFIICKPQSSPHSHICEGITLPSSEINGSPDKSLAHSPPCSKEHSPGRWTSECITWGTESGTGLKPQPDVILPPATRGAQANITVKGIPCSYESKTSS